MPKPIASLIYLAPSPYQELMATLGLKLPIAARSAMNRDAANDSTIPESSRNNTLTSLSGGMRRNGFSQDAIEAALLKHNAEHCNPPLPDEEVKAIAASVSRYPPTGTVDPLSMTDAGNAEAFSNAIQDRVRYVHSQGWHIWNGLNWVRDGESQIMEIAKEAVRSMSTHSAFVQNEDAQRKWLGHVKISLQLSRLKAMLELAQSHPALSVSPTMLNSHPMLLGVANGVIELKTGRLRLARKEDLLTTHSPIQFDPNAKCPKFHAFLLTTFSGDKKLMAYIQRVVGYALSGETSEQAYFFLHGSGANGKSTLLNVIAELLGQGLVKTIQPESLMANRSSTTNDLARLQGARVVLSNETESGTRLNEALVKQMTGGERITARFLYMEHFEFVPQFKLFVAGNHKPAIVGRDNGIWRRVKTIPFEVSIPPNMRNPKLGEELKAELPGILNWALKGYQDWKKNGLSEPSVISDAIAEYRNEMDIIGQWLENDCVKDPAAEIKASLAYDHFKLWCERNGYSKPMTSANFYREFKVMFTHVKRNDGNYYLGVKSRYP
ncbi:phage/plasmid primase, P4 family [Ottowia thiooxydans]|uniref:phage/plasmid primase, P4 family n=1 Tax=Ottowia thiooxydans TaxID=219182 RepID=UPI00068819FF|nr:phage/plasmid primase, P4 family [Ottowia thiooxydans]